MKAGKLLHIVALVATLSAAYAHAATVTIIHGINGLDLSSARSLPVDIAINGTCTVNGIKFTESKKTTLADGTYRITVHPANGSCTSSSIIDRTITIKDQSSISVVAKVTAAGTPGLAVYDNTVLGIAVGVRHVASAPSLVVRIKPARYTAQPWTRIRNSGEGAVFAAWDSALDYRITVSLTRQGEELRKLTGKFRSNHIIWRYFYIVGSIKNGLEIVQQDIRPSKPS